MKVSVKAITDDKNITRFFIILNKKEKEIGAQYNARNIEAKRKFLETTAKNFLKLGFTRANENIVLKDYLDNTLDICSGFLNVE